MMSYCPENGNPGFDVKTPRILKYKIIICCCHILDFNLISSYQIASLFHMYIYMGDRIAGKQNRPV